jgi:hypothetical protein
MRVGLKSQLRQTVQIASRVPLNKLKYEWNKQFSADRSAVGLPETNHHVSGTSAFQPSPEESAHGRHCGLAPCVDGSELARKTLRRIAGRCSHVFGLFARFT